MTQQKLGGFASPLEAATSGVVEKLLYVPAVLTRAGQPGDQPPAPDYLATVDVDPSSPTYSRVIHRLPMPGGSGDELHHVGWNACSSCRTKEGARPHNFLVLVGVLSGNIYFVDVKTDPRAPSIFKTIPGAEVRAKTGLALPHTTHCAPDEIIISHMGGVKADDVAAGEGEGGTLPPGAGNGFLAIDPKTLEIKGRWEAPSDNAAAKPLFGYDFWYAPRADVMVSSEWGEPAAFGRGFNPADVAAGRYGRRLHFWSWSQRKIVQTLDLGLGSIPLEVRFLHDPDATVGFVACALSSEIVRFWRPGGPGTEWRAEPVITVPPLPVEGWALPQMPALITDFVISLDDKWLYLANWLHGDLRQYDISDPAAPVLKGQVFVGGSLRAGSGVTVTEPGFVQPAPLVVRGVEVQGGAQMVQLSLDGTRLYVTTSLFSAWDAQFYPDLVKRGGQLLQIDVDAVNGGLTVNEAFVADFGAGEPWGPALAHEMRFPGGDCTSDIWV